MNPYRTYEDNMAVLNKVLAQRTHMALSRRNIEFILKHQNDSLQELAAYLQRRRAELRHIPGRTEVIGGDFIELRFRGWVNALVAIGVNRELAAKRGTPALEKTALYQAEFTTQREMDKAAKAEAKKANKAKKDQGIEHKSRAELLVDEEVTRRTMYVLQLRGFECPQNKNVRKTQEFRTEYQRQLAAFEQEQAAEKEARRAVRQAEQQEPAADENAQ